MAPKHYRVVSYDDQSDEENKLGVPMSPNTQRRYNAQITMEASLSSLPFPSHFTRLTT